MKIKRSELKELAIKFIGDNSIQAQNLILLKIATARCARVSYTIVGEEEKEPNYENDIKLHDRLSSSGHWSPFEHCARAMDDIEHRSNFIKQSNGHSTSLNSQEGKGWSGNFRGFIQYRKMFENENITKI